MANFQRFHQLRRTAAIRAKNAETTLTSSDLVLPIFVREGSRQSKPIPKMPGVCHHSLQSAVEKVEQVLQNGVKKILIFGVPASKSDTGANAYDPNGVVPQVVHTLKKKFGRRAELITDVCLCSYLRSGHCGLLRSDGTLDNDATLKIVAKIAAVHTAAGADWVAPSGCCDGVVATLRSALPESVRILGYSAKFASGFYGPFRAAAECAPSRGDRRSYQIPPGNASEALAEITADLAEGVDGIMVKPAGIYLDIIARARRLTPLPLFAYQVSGEYTSLLTGVSKGYLPQSAIAESLLAIRRAGADFVISYFADRPELWQCNDF